MSTNPERDALLHRIKQSRSPLRKGLVMEQLSEDVLTQIDRCLVLIERPHRQLKQVTTWLFMFAGFLWIPFFFPSLVSFSPETLAAFKANQSRLYLILLSLWGYIKHRRMKQMAGLCQLSSALDKKWYALTRDDLVASGEWSNCEGLWKLPDSDKSYFHIVLSWFFVLLGVGQLARQCWLLIS